MTDPNADLKLAATLNDKLIDAQREIDRLRLSYIEEKSAFDASAKQVEELKERRNFYQDRIVKLKAERDLANESPLVKALTDNANQTLFKHNEDLSKRLGELQSKLKTAVEALEKITESFPATVGPCEDMLEDWMSAVSRHKYAATVALAKIGNTNE